MRIIKKYSNRRLYDTQTSGYVNLEGLAEIIRSNEQVQVIDAGTGDDLTRGVLLQVILEVQGAAELMPVGLLHRMIRMSTPANALLQRQLSAGLEMFDAQFTRLEQQWRWVKPDRPPAAAPPPEEPPPTEEAPPPPQDEAAELRARLAALEERLKRR